MMAIAAFILAMPVLLYLDYYRSVGTSPFTSYTANVRFLDAKLPIIEQTNLRMLSNLPGGCKFFATETHYSIDFERSDCSFPPLGWFDNRTESAVAGEQYELLRKEIFSWRANFAWIRAQTDEAGQVVAYEFLLSSDPASFLFTKQAGLKFYRYEDSRTNANGQDKSRFEEIDANVKTKLMDNWYLIQNR